jgi:hypothetical protein
MKKHYIYTFLLFLLIRSAAAQAPALRGIYIDNFSDILGNTVKEDSLLHYAQDSSYNYLALYDLHSFNLNNASTANTMAAFIKRGRENFGITYIGAVGESYSSFSNDIAPYNLNRSDDHEKFNVFNLEFEFWTSSSVNPGGYYCTQYLQQANCSCDTSGGFKFFIEQMHLIDSLAATQGVLSETYLGWFNQGQGSQIQQNVDRILLHAYRTNTSTLYSYSKTRLQYLASNNTPVEVAPIFSAEPSFMGPWLDSHTEYDAYSQYFADYNNDNSSWKQYINLIGYQWFDYGWMPKPVPGSSGTFNPVIAMSGSGTICNGDSITLTASHGDSYHWSNGALTQSINVKTTGSYTCDVTLNGNTQTTGAASILVKNRPTASVSSGNLVAGQMQLSASASAGSGTISSYQWMINSGNISGATAATYNATISGNYSVKVTNSYGCNETSSQQTVTIPGSCMTSVPTGLSSTAGLDMSQVLSWAPGQTGDSIVIRYHPDSASTYDYVRMVNNGQTTHILNGLIPSTTYSWRVKTVCGNTSGSYSSKNYFTTASSTGIHQFTATTDHGFNVYPNPAQGKVHIDYSSNLNCKGKIILSDINGRTVLDEDVSVQQGDNKFYIGLTAYKNGIYTLTFKSDESLLVQKLVVEN